MYIYSGIAYCIFVIISLKNPSAVQGVKSASISRFPGDTVQCNDGILHFIPFLRIDCTTAALVSMLKRQGKYGFLTDSCRARNQS